MSDQPIREKNGDRRVGALLLLGLVALCAAAYVAGYFFTSDKVPSGASVSGVQIGGLKPAAAERKLVQELAARTRQPIRVRAGDQHSTIDPREAGLSVDAAASVAQAGGGRSWNPERMWEFFAGGERYDALVVIDEPALERAVAPITEKVDRPARDGRVTFTGGRPRSTFGEAGRAVDREAAAEAVAAAFLDGLSSSPDTDVVDLPVEEVEPEITDAEVRQAMDEFANPAMRTSVDIVFGDRIVPLRPDAYSKALSMTERNGTLVPTLSENALLREVRPALRAAAVAPRNATVRLVGGAPRVIPARAGRTFDSDDVADGFLSVVVAEGDARTLEVDSVKDKPEFTSADARALKIKRVVSSFTTYFPYAEYRNVNLARAAELVTGTVLRPGETFSLNDTVGERTAANGFVKGFIISDGIFEEDFGGGVSQVATTLFNAAFFAGLEDVEHKPHSFYIDRYPIGREATVAWGSVDLRFKNDTPYGILIQAGVKPSTPTRDGAMNVRFWSTKHWDITTGLSDQYNFTTEQTRIISDEECTPNDGYGGFEIDVYRYFRKPDSEKLVRRETMHTTYTPSDTVICQ